MVSPCVLILRAPGTNCNEETAFAFQQAGGRPEQVHINRWLEKPELADRYQILCIPGGFSYGDDLAAGRILANQLRLHLADALHRFHEQGKLILGICNGFQVLVQTGLFVPPDAQGPLVTLGWNERGQFEDRWVSLRVCGSKCVFLSGIESLSLPIAHAEGKFIARDMDALEEIDRAGQLVLRYTLPRSPSSSGRPDPIPYPANPNGSQFDVAGICDPTGRVFGLMPHPERFIRWTQHPCWTRAERPAIGDGLKIFQNAMAYFS
ncbi:MAG: phosphoribosylformylglycinamidine synthase I [Pirellulales bacterium]|nr:phosphoribosylformylglycinamidine synthase I [Pirellulales bacterium]